MKQKKDGPVVIADGWTGGSGSMYDDPYDFDGPRITNCLLGRDIAGHVAKPLIFLASKEVSEEQLRENNALLRQEH